MLQPRALPLALYSIIGGEDWTEAHVFSITDSRFRSDAPRHAACRYSDVQRRKGAASRSQRCLASGFQPDARKEFCLRQCVRLLHWEPNPTPVILTHYAVVTDVPRFISMNNRDFRWGIGAPEKPLHNLVSVASAPHFFSILCLSRGMPI